MTDQDFATRVYGAVKALNDAFSAAHNAGLTIDLRVLHVVNGHVLTGKPVVMVKLSRVVPVLEEDESYFGEDGPDGPLGAP